MNLLFICSKNQWRSPTAGAMYKNSQEHTARSAGTSPNAHIKASQSLIDWADIVFVMEQRHKRILQERFDINTQIVVLDIPDEYQYMDPELIELITSSVEPYLD